MKRAWCVTLAAFCLSLPAVAQDRPARGPSDRPGYGREARPQPEGRGGMLERAARRLTEELDLSAEQQAELQEIVAGFRARMRERGPGGAGAPLREFFAEVETILNEEQLKKFGPLRERLSSALREREGYRGFGRLLQELPEQLELDEQQRARFDGLAAELRQKGESRRAKMEELRPLVEEERQARRDGNEQRAAELREQIEQARSAAGRPVEEFLDQLEQILREDQKPRLAEIRKQWAAGAGSSGPQDLRSVLQASRRVDLDEQQREQVQAISQEAMRKARELDRGDRDARVALARDVKSQIVALLRPEQVQQFERMLRDQERQRDRDRPADRPRPNERAPRSPGGQPGP